MQAKPSFGNPFFGVCPRLSVLPNLMSQYPCLDLDPTGCTPFISATTTAATGDLEGSTRPNGGSLMAMPENPVKDDQFQSISWGSASVKDSDDIVHTPWNGNKTSSYTCPLLPKDNDTFLEFDFSGLVPYGHGERHHTLQEDSHAERWPYGSLLPLSGSPAKDDHLQGIPLGVVSPNCLNDLAHMPWNGNALSLNSFPPVPKDDGTFLGHEEPGLAPHGDEKQSHTLRGELKAERWPYGYHMPVGYLPACKSNPRRKRRRFTNGEKMIIRYKRKVGVCRDCRNAKRKASFATRSVFFCLYSVISAPMSNLIWETTPLKAAPES